MKRTMSCPKQTFVIGLIILMLALALSGCVKAPENKEELYVQNYRLLLYYANTEYIETGDEDVPKMMEPLVVKMRSTPAEVYTDTIEYLMQIPSDPKYTTMVPESLIINSTEVEDGTAFVDLSSRNLNGGSLQETIMITQIVNSLLKSFDEVDRVQFLVDGAPAETVMGHVMATDPFNWQDI